MSIDQLIATRLQSLRKTQGLSLEQLANNSGVSKAMISKIERQDSSPSASLLGRLAASLGVSLAQLLSEENPQPAPLRPQANQEVWQDPDIGYLRRQVTAHEKMVRPNWWKLPFQPERASAIPAGVSRLTSSACGW